MPLRSLLLLALLAVTSGTTCAPWPQTPPPGAQPTDLDFDAIHRAAQLALDLTDHNLGMTSEKRIAQRNLGAGQSLLLREVASTSYLVLFDEKTQTQIVAVPGTTNAENNDFNLHSELVFDQTAGGRIHAGYRDLALQIRDSLLPELRPGWPVTLVGYSQGGAVVALLPLWLLQDGVVLQTVITMGQPKVVDESLAGRMALLPIVRLIAANDMIPGYPRIEGYSQFGRSIELLDGPYIVSLLPGDPGYDDPRELPAELPDLLALDHATYDVRLRSKLGRMVYELSLEQAAALWP